MPSVLITGANRGLGFEFAKQYLAEMAGRSTRLVVTQIPLQSCADWLTRVATNSAF